MYFVYDTYMNVCTDYYIKNEYQKQIDKRKMRYSIATK